MNKKRIVNSLIAGVVCLWVSGCAPKADPYAAWRATQLTFLDINAVYNDLGLYLGWMTEDVEGRIRAAGKAGKDIKAIKEAVSAHPDLRQFPELKECLLNHLKEFGAMISLMESPGENMDGAGFVEAQKKAQAAFESCHRTLDQVYRLDSGVEDVESASLEQVMSLEQMMSAESYALYEELMNPESPHRDFETRLALWDQLLASQEDPFTRHSVIYQKVMTLLQPRRWMTGAAYESFDAQASRWKGCELLEGIMEDREYSPILFIVWRLWRAAVQNQMYGMSNYSEIPNQRYNQMRRQMVDVVVRHYQNNPNNLEARLQLDILCLYPIFYRGLEMGHSGMADMAEFLLW